MISRLHVVNWKEQHSSGKELGWMKWSSSFPDICNFQPGTSPCLPGQCAQPKMSRGSSEQEKSILMPIKKDKAPSGNATSVTVVASQRVVPSSQRETYVAIGGVSLNHP